MREWFRRWRERRLYKRLSRPVKRPTSLLLRFPRGYEYVPHPAGPREIGAEGIPFMPLRIAGLKLVGRGWEANEVKVSQILLGVEEAVDPELFWQWWRHLGGGPMWDEDGDIFVPWL